MSFSFLSIIKTRLVHSAYASFGGPLPILLARVCIEYAYKRLWDWNGSTGHSVCICLRILHVYYAYSRVHHNTSSYPSKVLPFSAFGNIIILLYSYAYSTSRVVRFHRQSNCIPLTLKSFCSSGQSWHDRDVE